MQGWRFPKLDGGVVSGLQNASMEHFRGSLVKSLVREICQNSIDAGEGRDVEVEFSYAEIPMTQFPGLSDFRHAIALANQYWSEENSSNEVAFLEKAKTILAQETMPVLRISDFNTSGLTGSQRSGRNSRWGGLVRSEGLSNNTNTAGGSFGIGKAAQFATSDLFTVFYNTYDEEGITASTGVSKLLNFRQEDGTETQSTWYYDQTGSAIQNALDLDATFNRKDAGHGTDIFITAFQAGEWEKDAVLAVISDFYYAIHNKRLVVTINGLRIDNESISGLFELYRDERIDFAYENYQALTSCETVWFEEDYYGGLVKIGLLPDNDYHRQVDIIRSTGMKIYQKNFRQLPFAGVFLVLGKEPSAFMRKLEDPTHTKLSADRGKNHSIPKAQANAFIRNIPALINECLAKLMEQDRQEEYDAGVGEYLPDECDDTDTKNKQEHITDRIHQIETRVSKPTPPAKQQEEEDFPQEDAADEDKDGDDTTQGSGDSRGTGDGGDTGGGTGSGDGDGEKITPVTPNEQGTLEWKYTPLDLDRVILIRGQQPGDYFVKLIPKESSTDAQISLSLVGETRKAPVKILSASVLGVDLAVSGSSIEGLKFVAGKPLPIKVSIDFDDYCSMEVHAYGCTL